MSFRYKYPSPEDYESQEEYEDACYAYDMAESAYIDSCIEQERINRSD